MPRVGSRAMGCWGTVRTTTGISRPGAAHGSRSAAGPSSCPAAANRPSTTSGRSWRAASITLEPSVMTSSSLDLRLDAQQVPDVRRYLRHILRHEQPNGVGVRHGPDYSKDAGAGLPRLRATRMTRSSWSASGSRSYVPATTSISRPAASAISRQFIDPDQPQQVLAVSSGGPPRPAPPPRRRPSAPPSRAPGRAVRWPSWRRAGRSPGPCGRIPGSIGRRSGPARRRPAARRPPRRDRPGPGAGPSSRRPPRWASREPSTSSEFRATKARPKRGPPGSSRPTRSASTALTRATMSGSTRAADSSRFRSRASMAGSMSTAVTS